MTDPRPPAGDEDLVPASVRLGAVVPPEDPEDWTRPLTWLAAFGMLAGPLAAFAWFAVASPSSAAAPSAGTWVVAMALALGAALAGATQLGQARAFAATAAAALFGALATIVVGAVLAGERQVAVASPTLAHALAAALAGLAGAGAAATLAPPFARHPSRLVRFLVPGAVGAAVAAMVVPLLMGS